MKLISLFIENFGKLHRYSLDFSNGQNTVCEENGWGKSTLAAFIKAMFYGLPRTRAQSLDDNERKKYTPWQGGTFGGNLVFKCSRGKFRVERSFGDVDTFLLTDLSTGLPSSAFSDSLGQELFGIDADGFERSAYLSSRSLLPSGKNDTVRAKLTGAIEDTNDMGNFERAYNTLDERAKEYKKTGNRGRIGELETEIRTLNEQLREKRRLLGEQKETEKELSQLRKKLAEISSEIERAQKDSVLAAQIEQCAKNIRALEEQQNSIRQKFDGDLPSAEDLEQQRRLVRQIQTDSADLRRIGLDAREQEELVRLSAVFPTGVPDRETLQQRYAASDNLRAEKSRIAAERERAEHNLATAQEKLRSLPSEEELAAALKSAPSSRNSKKPSSPKILLPFALILSAIGIPLLIVGVLKSNLPLTVGGGAALIAGMICLLLSRIGDSTATRGKNDAERSARELLSRFGQASLDDSRRALIALSEEIANARRSLTDAKTRFAELQAEESALRAKEADLRAFLSAYGIAETDTGNGLRRLFEQSRDWERLYGKQREAERTCAEKKHSLAEKTAAADRFFARCKTAVDLDLEERLHQVEVSLSRYDSLGEQIAQQKENLRRLLAENGLDTASFEVVSTDLAARNAQIGQLKQNHDVLAEQERNLSLTLARTVTETEKIPELEESAARLKEELADANDRYRLLKLTCDFLKDSREALTTRYLPQTRKNFEKYLSWITGENAPVAEVNAEFGVTVMDSGMTRVPEFYSRGWRDILQFCVRLALVDALFENGEKPFLLLDDPFTNLDENRLVFAKELLNRLASEFQVLYLVCHKDRV